MSKPICVITPHQKGFWQADYYREGWEEGEVPDGYCTGKVGGDKDSIIRKAKTSFPGTEFADGVTGVCADCSEEFALLETACTECGGIVGDP